MSFLLDSGLTVLWLGISVAAAVWLTVGECRAASRPGARLQRVFALLVVSMALFAPVSDADDVFSYLLLDGRLGQLGGSFGFGGAPTEDPQEKAGLQLVQLLESLEHYQPVGGMAPPPALLCLETAATPGLEVLTRAVVCRPGRAPPTA
jgi:hypothetical protein